MFSQIFNQLQFQPLQFHYDPLTTDRISSDPLLRDPYENLFVRLGQSHLPHAGQGDSFKLKKLDRCKR